MKNNSNSQLSLEEQRQIQLKGLLYLKNICDQNNLTYFLISGTLLGAVKYKGYIPWDDDIDIALLREDYLKLIDIIEHDNNPDYEILTIHNTKDYYYPYAKLVNKKTKLIDNAKEIKKLGVFIDVFPMDSFDDNIEKIFYKTRFLRNLVSKRMKIKNNIPKTSLLEKTEKKVKNKFIKDLIYELIDICSLPLGYKFWVKILDKTLANSKGKKYISTLYLSGKNYFNKNLFSEIVEYDFEGHKFTSIKNSDAYLRKLYGNYWQDPPKEDQRTHHQLNVTWRE